MKPQKWRAWQVNILKGQYTAKEQETSGWNDTPLSLRTPIPAPCHSPHDMVHRLLTAWSKTYTHVCKYFISATRYYMTGESTIFPMFADGMYNVFNIRLILYHWLTLIFHIWSLRLHVDLITHAISTKMCSCYGGSTYM